MTVALATLTNTWSDLLKARSDLLDYIALLREGSESVELAIIEREAKAAFEDIDGLVSELLDFRA